MTDLTRLLEEAFAGKDAAFDEVHPVVVEQLRARASHLMAHERRGHTLQTTDLLHETFIRLREAKRLRLNDREHFFAIAARIMRRILINHEERRLAQKRGNAKRRVSLEEAGSVAESEPGAESVDLLALNDALRRLESRPSESAKRMHQIVEMHFFGFMEIQEIAECLGINRKTVSRDLRAALAVLKAEC